jgi:hypothetical protein
MKTHGIWWCIAGAGWVVSLPEDHGQQRLFECRKGYPKWGSEWTGHKPLLFSKEEAERLAAEFSLLGIGQYEARVYTSAEKKQSLSPIEFVRNYKP